MHPSNSKVSFNIAESRRRATDLPSQLSTTKVATKEILATERPVDLQVLDVQQRKVLKP